MSDATAARLRRFFAFHEPTQLPVVPQWLANWAGQHDLMFASLIAYHGAEPPLTYSTTADRAACVLSRRQVILRECRALLQQLLLFYAPEDIASVDDVMQSWETNEAALMHHLEKIAARRDAIFRFFHRHDRKHMAYAVQLAREWFGAEAHLLRYLDAHSGSLPTRTLPFPLLTLPESSRVGHARQRLVAFLRQYQPNRLADCDAMLEAYRGREEEMFGMLASRFGAPAHSTAVTTIGGAPAGGAGNHKSTVVPHDFITSDFGCCVQLLAESWLGSDTAELEQVEEMLSKLLGTAIAPGELLLRLAGEVGGANKKPPRSD